MGILILRLVIGLGFAAHGTQKLFGWFGGYGIEGTGGFLESLGFRPGKTFAVVAGLTELVAGLLLVAGLATPLAAAGIVGVMFNAWATTKRGKGFFAQNGGAELDILYAVGAIVPAFAGAGIYSLDHALGLSVAGIGWGIAALTVGVVTGLANLAARRPVAVPEVVAA